MAHQAEYARLASARAALQTVKCSSCTCAGVIVRRRYPARAASNLISPTPIAHLPDDQQADHDEQRRRVQHVEQDVAGVGERDHWFSASESSQRPSTVNITITTSMTTWEAIAARGLP